MWISLVKFVALPLVGSWSALPLCNPICPGFEPLPNPLHTHLNKDSQTTNHLVTGSCPSAWQCMSHYVTWCHPVPFLLQPLALLTTFISWLCGKHLKLKTVRTKILMRGASYFPQLSTNLWNIGVQVDFYFVCFVLSSKAGIKRGVEQLAKVRMVGVVRDHDTLFFVNGWFLKCNMKYFKQARAELCQAQVKHRSARILIKRHGTTTVFGCIIFLRVVFHFQ